MGADGKLDVAGSVFIRETFLKELLLNGPRHIFWAVTGSSMALVWLSIATAPPNGHVLMEHCQDVTLPSSISGDQMGLLRAHLVRFHDHRPKNLTT